MSNMCAAPSTNRLLVVANDVHNPLVDTGRPTINVLKEKKPQLSQVERKMDDAGGREAVQKEKKSPDPALFRPVSLAVHSHTVRTATDNERLPPNPLTGKDGRHFSSIACGRGGRTRQGDGSPAELGPLSLIGNPTRDR